MQVMLLQLCCLNAYKYYLDIQKPDNGDVQEFVQGLFLADQRDPCGAPELGSGAGERHID